MYELEDDLNPPVEYNLSDLKSQILVSGSDITIAASGYSTQLALQASSVLLQSGISAEVVDLRVLNPFDPSVVIESVLKTKSLLVIDGGWAPCGFSSEVISSVVERLPTTTLKFPPSRITLPYAPAPSSTVQEQSYYPSCSSVVNHVLNLVSSDSH